MSTELFADGLPTRAWGGESVTLRLAGDLYHVSGLCPSQVDVLDKRFGAAFTRDTDTEILEIALYRATESQLESRPPLDDVGVVRSYPAAGFVEVTGLHSYGVLTLNPSVAGQLWTWHGAGVQFWLAFENFLRLTVAYRLLLADGILLHSSAVVSNGRVDVGFGRSGSGKTTISSVRQSEGATVLSDDMVALRIGSDGIRAQALPFAGDLDTWSQLGTSYPVRSLVKLEKSSGNRLTGPMGRGSAAANLMICAPYVNGDSQLIERLMHTVDSICDVIPVMTLGFNPAKGLDQFLEQKFG